MCFPIKIMYCAHAPLILFPTRCFCPTGFCTRGFSEVNVLTVWNTARGGSVRIWSVQAVRIGRPELERLSMRRGVETSHHETSRKQDISSWISGSRRFSLLRWLYKESLYGTIGNQVIQAINLYLYFEQVMSPA